MDFSDVIEKLEIDKLHLEAEREGQREILWKKNQRCKLSDFEDG